MIVNAKLAMLLAAGTFSLSAAPAFAASALSERFVANVQPNIEFLDGSSRLALTASTSTKLRAFARAEVHAGADAGDTLAAWTQANAGAGQAADNDDAHAKDTSLAP